VVRSRRFAAEPNQTYPLSELNESSFTSTSGITIYRGAAYPRQYYGNVFVGEVAGNLIHRQILTPDGVTFRSRRAEEKSEFVRSTDNWFRPVNFVNAPDGTLHILDMYRETIEHPWSIPDDIMAQLDLLSGRDRGRIYRLAPSGFQVPRPPRLGSATTEELVAQLENPNVWWRETAHRLLFERQDRAAVEPLHQLLHQSGKPLARLGALWSLAGLNGLREEDLLRALADPESGVREHAVKLAEKRLQQAPEVLNRVLDVAKDPDLRVRFQVAFTLGEARDPRVPAALAMIAKRDAADPWVRTAVLSSAVASCDDLLLRVMKDDPLAATPSGLELARQLAAVVGARAHAAEMNRVLAAVAAKPASREARSLQTLVAAGLGDGLKRSGKSLRSIPTEAGTPAAKMLAAVLEEAQPVARDARAALGQRREAVALLGYDDYERVKTTLVALLDARQPPDVQMAAVRTLGGFPQTEVVRLLLQSWRTYTPAVRGEAVDALLARADRLALVLDAVESRTVAVGDIPPTRRALLLRRADDALRQRAAALFSRETLQARKEVLAKYQPALRLAADKARGEKVFARECSTCHRLGSQGNDVGPNLDTIQNRTAEEVMISVFDPNREVAPNYLEYLVVLKDGRTTTGIIAAETATSITLRRASNVQETILRQNIDEITSTGKSLMPEGLEKKLTLQDVADLLAFLVPAK
jgi:putative heme-binding domain-containing protein